MVHSKPITLPGRLSGLIFQSSKIESAVVEAPPPPPPEPTGPSQADLLAEERQALQAVLANLKEAAREISAHHVAPLHELQRLAIELGMAVAARIVHARLASGDFPIENMVRDLIAHLQPKHPVTVYLHPDDLRLLERRLGERLTGLIPETQIHYRPDLELKRGDCKAETGDLCVWSELQRQLWEMRDLLLEGLPFDLPGPT